MTLSDKTPGVDQNQNSPAESAGNSPMQSLEQINLLVRNCTDCPLSNGRTNSVPGEGNPQADVMFIGEGSGYYGSSLCGPRRQADGPTLSFD